MATAIAPNPTRGGLSASDFEARQAARRRDRALDTLNNLNEDLEIPAPVTEIIPRDTRGLAPKLSAEAFELARQVYYLQHGNIADAARAIIAAGLADTDDHVVVRGRLQTWWEREQWPKRSILDVLAVRDANHDGGLYRSAKRCIGAAVGNGPAPQGKPCAQSALPDSNYCYHHDPRPEYEAERRRHEQHLREGRNRDLVDAKPFQDFCQAKRTELLEAARRSPRPPHANNQGWKLLADAMGVNNSLLARIVQQGHSHSGDGWPGSVKNKIRASTVTRYLAPLGVTFADVYGHEPPAMGDGNLICPDCGGPKNHEAKRCYTCHQATLGDPCQYVNSKGRACRRPTKHQSGYCYKCRRVVHRERRPRPGRRTFLTTAMLTLAVDAYRENHSWAWAARRMWAVNAAGCRDVYKDLKSLTGSIVKQARRRDINAGNADEVLEQLTSEHGPVAWPDPDGSLPLEAAGMVPMEPFRQWLIARHAEHGSYAKLAARLATCPDTLSQWIRGEGRGAQATIRRATVDVNLQAYGDGTTFTDVYRGVA